MAIVNQSAAASISMGQELAEVAEQLRSRTVEIRSADSGRGSGVIWRRDGLIVTNAHVATDPHPRIRLANGRWLSGNVLHRDERHDLAFVQVNASDFPPVQVRDPASLRTGELLLAVGHPADGAGACAVGILAGRPGQSDWLVKADIRLAPGYSGGPLSDAQGQIVGINSMVVAGFGVAVSAAMAQRLIDHPRPRIGVTLQPVITPARQSPSLGLMVVELEPGAPAHLSGLMVGDVLIGVEGKVLNSAGQLSDAITFATNNLRLELLRGGRRQQCDIVLLRERAIGAA
jgi:serine protease Do